MTAREWLCKKYSAAINENFSICYRPYEGGSLVEAVNIDDAVKRFDEDVEENKHFLACFDVGEEEAFDMTCRIWEKHLVIW